MSINSGMMSSTTAEWATPQDLFDDMDAKYGPFTLDPCCTDYNAKCDEHFTEVEDGLARRWTGRVFMNPPYGRRIQHWIRKAYESCRGGDTEIVVCLIPSRTDTAWWHDYCMKGDVTFIRGRVYFEQEGKSDRAPFPSAIVVFRARNNPPADVAQARYEKAEAELAALQARRCETCADRDDHAVDEPCDRFSDSFLAFMRDHCNGKPVSCCFWTERGAA